MSDPTFADLIGADDAPLNDHDLGDLEGGEARVLGLMSDHLWHGREAIEKAASPVAGSRAEEGLRRMRTLRQRGHKITKRRIPGSRFWEYRLEPKESTPCADSSS